VSASGCIAEGRIHGSVSWLKLHLRYDFDKSFAALLIELPIIMSGKMMSSTIVLCILFSLSYASILDRRGADNCLRAVRATDKGASFMSQATADCSSFLAASVGLTTITTTPAFV
jgi:hypothetical protein